jgi:hypothetical protein
MLRDALEIAEFAALTTLVAISDNCDKWFINICISNISPMLIELLRLLIELSFALALIVAALITENSTFTLKPDCTLLPEYMFGLKPGIVIPPN